MNDKLKHILNSLLTDPDVLSDKDVAALTSGFPFEFPRSYLDVIRFINGQEGEVGPDSWICLFPLAALADVNHSYRMLMESIPDYFLIGKDAADTGYAFHKTRGTFHSFGLMSNFKTDSIDFMGNDFYELLEKLYNYRFKD
jgi:hypothetical protein